MELEAAELMVMQAAWLYDQGKAVRRGSQRRQIPRRRSGFRACETAVMTHGGMGYAKEFHVERYFREAMIAAHRARSARS